MRKILFVCTGNICRSPTAEGVARHLIETAGMAGVVEVDSAGTHGFHVGEAPDPRAQKAAAQKGYDLSTLRARKLEALDFERFDLLLAMDRGHLQAMLRLCPQDHRSKVELFMRYAPGGSYEEVPDPYYGGPTGFDAVLQMCEQGVRGLLGAIDSGR